MSMYQQALMSQRRALETGRSLKSSDDSPLPSRKLMCRWDLPDTPPTHILSSLIHWLQTSSALSHTTSSSSQDSKAYAQHSLAKHILAGLEDDFLVPLLVLQSALRSSNEKHYTSSTYYLLPLCVFVSTLTLFNPSVCW